MPANGKAEVLPVIAQLRQLISTLEVNGGATCCAVTILSQDAKSGILSISSVTEYGPDDEHKLFSAMAQALGYGKVN